MDIVKLDQFITQLDSEFSIATEEDRTEAISAVKTCLHDLRESMAGIAKENNKLIIAIVGQTNVGKSSLLNALLFEGVEVLPTSSTPMTACLTVIEYVDKLEDQRLEVEFYTQQEWENIKGKYDFVNERLKKFKNENEELNGRALKNEFKKFCDEEQLDFQNLLAFYELYEKKLKYPECDEKIGKVNDCIKFTNLSEVSGSLKQYVGSSGEYAPVVNTVYIYVNSPLLTYKNLQTGETESYKIVDTPGINDPVESRDNVAKRFLKEAHAAIMVTRADRSRTQTDTNFINGHIIKGGSSKILITFNKLDLRFESEAMDDDLTDSFLAAMSDFVGYEDGVYENRGELYDTFNGEIKPKLTNGDYVLWTATCPYAENIRAKLNKAGGNIQAAHLLEEESATLTQLQEWFPEDFSEESPNLIFNLSLLGGLQHLKDDFLLNEFLSNKDRIVANKYDNSLRNLRNKVIEQFDKKIKEINEKQNLLNSVNLKDLKDQIRIIEILKEEGMADLCECVDVVINRLKAFVNKTLFANKLTSYKITLNSNATGYDSVSYTRKGTNKSFLGGNIKYEEASVNRVQPEAVVSSHHQQIDRLHEQLNKLWKEQFLKERNALIESLKQCIETIATKDNTIGINPSVYIKALEKLIDKELLGREILDIGSWIDKQKIDLDEYARKAEHVSLSTNYSETRMTKEEAQNRIQKQASQKIADFKKGMSTRYIDFYDALKGQIAKEIEDINNKLKTFVIEVTTKLQEVLENFIKEKKELIGDRENTEKKKKQLIDDLMSLKKQFEKL